jgi:hypothetical protein
MCLPIIYPLAALCFSEFAGALAARFVQRPFADGAIKLTKCFPAFIA